MSPNELLNNVLRTLVQKYERNKTPRVSSREKVLEVYKTNNNPRFILDFQDLISVLEKKNVLKVKRFSDQTSIQNLVLADYDQAIKILGHTPLESRLNQACNLFNNSICNSFFAERTLQDALGKWKSGSAFLGCSVDDADKLVEITNAGLSVMKVKKIGETLDYRHFGAIYLKHSKRLNEIQGKICEWLKLFDDDVQGLTNEEILAVYGIVKLNHAIYLSGSIKLISSGIDLDCRFKGGVGVKGNYVDSVKLLIEIQTLTTIENKATFDRYIETKSNSNEVVMFTSGIPSPEFIKLYRLIESICQPENIQHWGDIDVGGFTILNMLESSLDKPVRALFLEPKNYLQSYGQFSEKEIDLVKKRLKTTTNKNAIERCLKYGSKFEQEAFVW